MIGLHYNQNIRIHQKGFSLLEVLIALLIATVGLFSLSSMQVSAIKGNSSSNERTRAAYLAQGIIEQLGNGHLVNGSVFGFMVMSTEIPDTPLESGVMNGIDEQGEAGGPFHLQWQVTHHTSWARSMTVTVTWQSILGITRYLRITSISRGGNDR